jgi:hypothetical protein
MAGSRHKKPTVTGTCTPGGAAAAAAAADNDDNNLSFFLAPDLTRTSPCAPTLLGFKRCTMLLCLWVAMPLPTPVHMPWDGRGPAWSLLRPRSITPSNNARAGEREEAWKVCALKHHFFNISHKPINWDEDAQLEKQHIWATCFISSQPKHCSIQGIDSSGQCTSESAMFISREPIPGFCASEARGH